MSSRRFSREAWLHINYLEKKHQDKAASNGGDRRVILDQDTVRQHLAIPVEEFPEELPELDEQEKAAVIYWLSVSSRFSY